MCISPGLQEQVFKGVFLSAEADEGAGAGEGLSAGWPGCVGASQRMVPDPDPQHH